MSVFQFLLHQDFGRTNRIEWNEPVLRFSSFFIRTSAGPRAIGAWLFECVSVPSSSGLRPDGELSTGGHITMFQFLLHQDFGRTSGVHETGACLWVSVPSSSGLRPDPRVHHRGECDEFQFLLHQDFGRTEGEGFMDRDTMVSVPSSSGLRPDIALMIVGAVLAVSVPSSSGLRPDRGGVCIKAPFGFQFLLHQDFGRTVLGVYGEILQGFQFLLHQDFGRTVSRSGPLTAMVSVPSSSGLRPDCPKTPYRENISVSVPSSSGLRPDVRLHNLCKQ